MESKALLKAGNDFVVLEESKFEAETQLREAFKSKRVVVPPPTGLAGLHS